MFVLTLNISWKLLVNIRGNMPSVFMKETKNTQLRSYSCLGCFKSAKNFICQKVPQQPMYQLRQLVYQETGHHKQFSCLEFKQPYLLISTFTCGGRFILLCSPMHLYIFRTFEDLKKKLFYRVISHNDLQCPSLPVSNCMKEIFLRLNVSVTQNVSSESSF